MEFFKFSIIFVCVFMIMISVVVASSGRDIFIPFICMITFGGFIALLYDKDL